MSSFGRAPAPRDPFGMIPSPSRQQAAGIYPTALPYGDKSTRATATQPGDKTGWESPNASPHRPAPTTPVRGAAARAAAGAAPPAAPTTGDETAAVMQVTNAAARLLEGGGGSAAEVRTALME